MTLTFYCHWKGKNSPFPTTHWKTNCGDAIYRVPPPHSFIARPIHTLSLLPSLKLSNMIEKTNRAQIPMIVFIENWWSMK